MKSESSPRAFLGSLVLALLAFALPTVAAQRLNVLFIAVDDLVNLLSPAGHPGLKTPHLDRPAAPGCPFTR